MGKRITLGGERLGTGKKMSVYAHGYNRATFNLSKVFRSSLSCGTLVPFYTNIGLNGDSFDINVRHLLKTLPTNSPLMGSFKIQMDFFVSPIRLYNGLLHNNALNVGMKMEEIKIPKVRIKQQINKAFNITETYQQISPSSLMAYLGVRGLGSYPDGYEGTFIERDFNALPILSYYDIFKNYYSNKQEENFYYISTDEEILLSKFTRIYYTRDIDEGITDIREVQLPEENMYNYVAEGQIANTAFYFQPNTKPKIWFTFESYEDMSSFYDDYINGRLGINLTFSSVNNLIISKWYKLKDLFTTAKMVEKKSAKIIDNTEDIIFQAQRIYKYAVSLENLGDIVKYDNEIETEYPTGDLLYFIHGFQNYGDANSRNITKLIPCKLEVLDDIRNWILSKTDDQFGQTLFINDFYPQNPFKALTEQTASGQTKNRYAQNGLVVKTYLSDLFNNWLSKEHIEGANGINEIARVSTTDGSFSIDALNLAQKVYNLLNRIAVSGGTYEDWQEIVWDEKAVRKAESPMYVGGYSTEIIFEEVTQTSETNETPLGNLGGKGKTAGQKGGTIAFKIKEPSIIMGIVSITPRIDYSQGNKWYMTNLDTMDDLHKPAMDGIGFQDLMTERLVATDTIFEHQGAGRLTKANEQLSVGKQPAYIEWQADYNEVFGDFAMPNKAMYMTLARNYDTDEFGRVLDVTTYIDPQKYNYAFADAALEAQNFWLQIACDIKARRKMSASQIPNI